MSALKAYILSADDTDMWAEEVQDDPELAVAAWGAIKEMKDEIIADRVSRDRRYNAFCVLTALTTNTPNTEELR